MTDALTAQQQVAQDLAMFQTPNLDGVDLTTVFTDQAELQQELARGEGLAPKGGGPKDWWFSEMGQQIVQMVPFAVPIPGMPGKVKWTWVSNYHHHNGFFPKDHPIVKEMKKHLPGWALMCPAQTYGKECIVCELRFTFGNHYKDHTQEGWKHPDIRNNGLWADERSLSYVQVLEGSGAWLQTERGQQWEQQCLGSYRDKALSVFNEGIVEAKKSLAEEEAWDPRKPYLTILNKNQYKEIKQISLHPSIGDIANPLNGVPFAMTVSVNTKTNYRDHHVMQLAARPLLADAAGQPDQVGIMEMLKATKNLYGYRLPWSAEVTAAVRQRVAQIEAAYLGKGPSHPVANIGPPGTGAAPSSYMGTGGGFPALPAPAAPPVSVGPGIPAAAMPPAAPVPAAVSVGPVAPFLPPVAGPPPVAAPPMVVGPPPMTGPPPPMAGPAPVAAAMPAAAIPPVAPAAAPPMVPPVAVAPLAPPAPMVPPVAPALVAAVPAPVAPVAAVPAPVAPVAAVPAPVAPVAPVPAPVAPVAPVPATVAPVAPVPAPVPAPVAPVAAVPAPVAAVPAPVAPAPAQAAPAAPVAPPVQEVPVVASEAAQGPTANIGANGKPPCFKSGSYDSGSPVCLGCEFEISCSDG